MVFLAVSFRWTFRLLPFKKIINVTLSIFVCVYFFLDFGLFPLLEVGFLSQWE